MKVLWGLGKALTLIFWAVVLSNLYQPLINPFDVLVNLVASLLLLTHVLEVLFYTTRLQGRRHPWRDRLLILVFGFFTLTAFLPPTNEMPAMRKLCLLAALCSPFAHAEVVSVEANSMMRLPANASALRLEKLDVADYGTLLIPAGITRVEIDQLHLGREARITIVPAERGIELRVARADLGEGSQINARGASGTFEKPARPARDLNLRIESLQAPQLSIDARGGTGAPGFAGLDGGNGEEPGCTWGAAGSGANGDNGGNGQPGAAGGQVRVELPRDYPAEQVSVRVDGGAGGKPGEAGRAGAGGKAKGCVVYRTDGGKSGKPGLAGQAGDVGTAGAVTIQRL